jgi:hypothetical protein
MPLPTFSQKMSTHDMSHLRSAIAGYAVEMGTNLSESAAVPALGNW